MKVAHGLVLAAMLCVARVDAIDFSESSLASEDAGTLSTAEQVDVGAETSTLTDTADTPPVQSTGDTDASCSKEFELAPETTETVESPTSDSPEILEAPKILGAPETPETPETPTSDTPEVESPVPSDESCSKEFDIAGSDDCDQELEIANVDDCSQGMDIAGDDCDDGVDIAGADDCGEELDVAGDETTADVSTDSATTSTETTLDTTTPDASTPDISTLDTSETDTSTVDTSTDTSTPSTETETSSSGIPEEEPMNPGKSKKEAEPAEPLLPTFSDSPDTETETSVETPTTSSETETVPENPIDTSLDTANAPETESEYESLPSDGPVEEPMNPGKSKKEAEPAEPLLPTFSDSPDTATETSVETPINTFSETETVPENPIDTSLDTANTPETGSESESLPSDVSVEEPMNPGKSKKEAEPAEPLLPTFSDSPDAATETLVETPIDTSLETPSETLVDASAEVPAEETPADVSSDTSTVPVPEVLTAASRDGPVPPESTEESTIDTLTDTATTPDAETPTEEDCLDGLDIADTEDCSKELDIAGSDCEEELNIAGTDSCSQEFDIPDIPEIPAETPIDTFAESPTDDSCNEELDIAGPSDTPTDASCEDELDIAGNDDIAPLTLSPTASNTMSSSSTTADQSPEQVSAFSAGAVKFMSADDSVDTGTSLVVPIVAAAAVCAALAIVGMIYIKRRSHKSKKAAGGIFTVDKNSAL
ncbi:hypothetical protein CCR75_003294 [Bremia lactucae]|uniref:Uncharacterized protein n=1 Tax=Bremia lactucae TaxID=4779 RepID=A0A976IIT7_BRELC|nr:hypothetical protein CCR75_003294 [Bremia lactucae]